MRFWMTLAADTNAKAERENATRKYIVNRFTNEA
jgi:hypothetical protein